MSEKDIFKAISEGIQDGFKDIGFELNDREKKIIHMTTVAAITIVERIEKVDLDD
jgi:hypothetical protein